MPDFFLAPPVTVALRVSTNLEHGRRSEVAKLALLLEDVPEKLISMNDSAEINVNYATYNRVPGTDCPSRGANLEELVRLVGVSDARVDLQE